MTKGRLEAFSDGVLAIILTIMVLEIKVPHEPDLDALLKDVPLLLSYALSFVYVGIYWNNHHHLFHLTARIGGGVMWANLHLLFWLSLVPVATGWVGEHPDAPWPSALYGAILLMSGVAWLILQTAIIALNGRDSALARAIGRDFKGKISAVVYTTAIALSFVSPSFAHILYALVALMWVVPDRRMAATAEQEAARGAVKE